MSDPIPSATVILLRDTPSDMKVLLLKRNSKIAYGGSWVFPGGRIDPEEFVASNNDPFEAARLAAVRETEEETGIKISLDSLVFFSHWTTPIVKPKRFSTWFFLVPIKNKNVKVDGGEIHEFQWHTPLNALEQQIQTTIELPPPTFVTLTKLSRFDQSREALDYFSKQPPTHIQPHFFQTEDGAVYLYNGDAGYESKDPLAQGPRHRLLQPKGGRWQYVTEI